jgi:hypothetical protein
MMYWCHECQRDKAMREGADFDECDDNEVCPIIAASFQGTVPQWVYGPDGQPMCTAFVEAGKPLPVPRCAVTTDMFGETTQ